MLLTGLNFPSLGCLSAIRRSVILLQWVKEATLIANHERAGKDIAVERRKATSAL
jgi:hypothetical protein